jgi:hypothetical protein
MTNSVFLWSSSISLDGIFGFRLKLLKITALLDPCYVSSKNSVHIFKFSNFFISQASCTNTNPKTERTQSILSDILMSVSIF